MRNGASSLAWVLFLTSSVQAQSISPRVNNSTGGSYKVPNLNFYTDWNIGEMSLVNTMSSNGSRGGIYVITNGLLQNDKQLIENTSPIRKDSLIDFTSNNIKVFPDPARDHVYVHFFMANAGTVHLSLFNVDGLQVYSKQCTVSDKDFMQLISLDGLVPGTYLLNILMNSENGKNKRQTSYKIVKLN